MSISCCELCLEVMYYDVCINDPVRFCCVCGKYCSSKGKYDYLNSSKMFIKNIFLLKFHTKINHGFHIVYAKIAKLH